MDEKVLELLILLVGDRDATMLHHTLHKLSKTAYVKEYPDFIKRCEEEFAERFLRSLTRGTVEKVVDKVGREINVGDLVIAYSTFESSIVLSKVIFVSRFAPYMTLEPVRDDANFRHEFCPSGPVYVYDMNEHLIANMLKS